MKIVVLTPNYPRKNSRMNGIFIHQQIKALVALGLDCHVLMTYNWFPPLGLHRLHPYWKMGYDRHQQLFDEFEGVKIHKVPVFIKMPNRFFSEDPSLREAKVLAEYIKNSDEFFDVDWIYGNFLTDYAYIGVLIKQMIGIKTASIARGDDVHAWPQENPLLLPLIQEVFEKSDLLLANSARLAEDAKLLVTFPERRLMEVVYNGVDLDRFSPALEKERDQLRVKFGLKNKTKYLLCVATPVALKGWLVLLDAIATARDVFSGWVLLCVTVIRENTDALDLHKEALDRDIAQFIEVIGQLEHRDLAEYYQAVDAFVLPSLNEGLANVVLEAAASNLPILITDVGGHKEIFENSKSCQIAKPNDVQDLIGGLKNLVLSIDNIHDTRKIVSAQVGSYLKNAQKLKALFTAYNENSAEV